MKIIGDAMTPEEALRNILSLVDGSDEVEDSSVARARIRSMSVQKISLQRSVITR